MVPGLTERDMRAVELRRQDLLAEAVRDRAVAPAFRGQGRPSRRTTRVPSRMVDRVILSMRLPGVLAAAFRPRGAHP